MPPIGTPPERRLFACSSYSRTSSGFEESSRARVIEPPLIAALLDGNMMGTEQTLVNVRTFLPELVPELRGKMMEEERHGRRNEAA